VDYIPPAVWAHPVQLSLDWVKKFLLKRATVVILGDKRAEHALGQVVNKARELDSILARNWISWYGKTPDVFTDAYKVDRTEGLLAIAIREEVENDALLDKIRRHSGLVVIASRTPIPFLIPNHTLYLPNWKT
jgi:hypothetical protein